MVIANTNDPVFFPWLQTIFLKFHEGLLTVQDPSKNIKMTIQYWHLIIFVTNLN